MSVLSMHQKAKQYHGRMVKIHTKNGNVYVGKIMKVDAKRVHLQVSSVRSGKKVHTSFFPFILPLVLFDLLAIALLV
ncbi:hypothetical protein [Paenibacillus thalictri]|uniref:Uncharacterized protein n=1 Tax=Paenibacillus thalictri TaxID=2527873 RepID=A0A4Q9DNQ5_9BACL|nr:hypothetical protein [Paenibacillus thalictri]TBL77681.1 hypothetical protein EYB31_16155 [Paenibacillus thalictri]